MVVWLDEAGNPEQVATATYRGDDKLGETTWTPEPFDGPERAFNAALLALPIQLKLL